MANQNNRFLTVAMTGMVMIFSAMGADLKNTVPAEQQVPSPHMSKALGFSMIAVAASQAMDISSSYGMHELNPALAGQSGRFDAQSALLKAGIAGGLLAVEYVIARKHPNAAKVLWKLNLISAGATGAVAAHNYSLR